jgi:hypothetical protein
MRKLNDPAPLFKPFAKPYGNALGRKLLANALRLLVGVALDIAAVRSNDNQSRINLARDRSGTGQSQAVPQVVVRGFRISVSHQDNIRLVIVHFDHGIECEIQGLYSVWCIPFYANLLTGISPYRGNLVMVRRTMLTSRTAANVYTWYKSSGARWHGLTSVLFKDDSYTMRRTAQCRLIWSLNLKIDSDPNILLTNVPVPHATSAAERKRIP